MTAKLYDKLVDYSKNGRYPFHMPGHKMGRGIDIKDIFAMDITEIDGFDNLHNPTDIIKPVSYTHLIENGSLYINGNLIEGYDCGSTEDTSFVLAEDEIYVLGDNADESIDSRYFGPITKSNVEGLVLIRIYPFNEIQLLKG